MPPLELSQTGPESDLVVGGYRVERLLRSRSAEDAIYEAVHLDTGRRVELRAVSHQRRRRFESDVARLEAVGHPHLPRVHDAGEEKDVLFLATDFLDGPTLAEICADRPLPLMRAVRLLGSVADALDAAHAEGLVHGDVGLRSVVVVERHVEHAYLVDFVLGGPRGDGGPPAATPAGDVKALAVALGNVRPDRPPALDHLLAQATSPRAPRRSAGELLDDAARALMESPRRLELPPPAPAAPPDAARRRPFAALGRPFAALERWRIPLVAGALAVAAAGVGGFLAGSRPGEDGPATASSDAGVRVSLPPGWSEAGIARIPGLDLEGAVRASAPGGRGALVAGRVAGLRGSVYPANVAEALRRETIEAPAFGVPVSAGRPVRLERYEALRFTRTVDRAPAVLFVAPTGSGTLAVLCAGPAPLRDCEAAAASVELTGASALSLAAGRRFAAGLDRALRRLGAERARLTRSLSAARLSGAQAAAARRLAAGHRAARRSVVGLDAPAAAAPAQGRVAAALADIARSYDRVAGAARRHSARAYSRASAAVRRSEARLQGLLQRL